MTNSESALTDFIRQELLHGRSLSFTADDDLLSAGIVDSLGILRLVAFIQERFGIEIPDEDVVFENFQSVGAMVRYVAERSGAVPPAVAL